MKRRTILFLKWCLSKLGESDKPFTKEWVSGRVHDLENRGGGSRGFFELQLFSNSRNRYRVTWSVPIVSLSSVNEMHEAKAKEITKAIRKSLLIAADDLKEDGAV